MGDAPGGVETVAEPADAIREALVAELRDLLGDDVLAVHLDPGRDLWVRVATSAWVATAEALRGRGFDYFCFLSAVDWLPSPFGRSLDSDVDRRLDGAPLVKADQPIVHGVTGGDTRFQLIARLYSISRKLGVSLKVDVPDDTTSIATWSSTYGGANWHERQVHEAYGVVFEGHPSLRKLYLPGDFEGFPGRKDFPLLARMVKPWPGIVDVEGMPGAADDEGGE